MMMLSLIIGLSATAVLLAPLSAMASDVIPVNRSQPVLAVIDSKPTASATENGGKNYQKVNDHDQALSDHELSDNRAGQVIVTGNQTLNAVSSGNVLNGSYTAGAVIISGNALSNFNGVGNIAINTGAQVNLQSAMNLTVNVKP